MRARPTSAATLTTLTLERFLPYRLVVLADTVSRALATVYEQRFDVSIAEWRVIANLGRFGALSAGDLAAHSNLDKPKVTRALQRLLERGLISRAIEKNDRRQSRIALTRQGQTLFRDIARLALAWEKDWLATLSAADRKALDRLIINLQRHAANSARAGTQR
jgi:DNA-binding MarR family transcriptional regulator